MFNFILIMLGGLLLISINILALFKEKKKFNYLSDLKQSRFVIYLKRFIKFRIKRPADNLTKKDKVFITAIAVLFAFTANNIFAVTEYFFWGLLLGVMLLKFLTNLKAKAARTKKLKEISILFEAIELYTNAGYTVYQALKSASVLTHIIRPSIEKCLQYWSSSPRKALEMLQSELNLPESEILILLLVHMEIVGAKEMHGVLKSEATNINHSEIMKKQISISNRPLILMVYRILPLVSILGITVGSLLYRTYAVLVDAGIFPK